MPERLRSPTDDEPRDAGPGRWPTWTVIVVAAAAVTMTVPPTGAGGPVEPGPDLDPLHRKAGPTLADRIRDGPTDDLEVIVTGPPHDVTPHEAEDRDAAMRMLDRNAAPFLALVDRVAERQGGEVVARWSAAPAVKVVGGLDTVAALAALPAVRHVALDHPAAVELPVLPGSGEGDGPETMNSEGRKMIGAEETWESGFRGDGINISVVDTGIDPSHEAFKHANGSSRVEAFADCLDDGCNATVTPYDDHGHGTHVAGTAAGSSYYEDPDWGAFQETGVAPNATLVVAKFLDGAGRGSWQGAIDSLEWSFQQGADVTSNSWSGSCGSAQSVIQTVNTLTDLGMVSVFAAGNSGPGARSIGGPGCADSVITVGAVDVDLEIASFSSRGRCEDPTTEAAPRICPDVVAKGVDVRSAIPRSSASYARSSGYRVWRGTSMATPHVAGAVVLGEEMKRHIDGEGWDTPHGEERDAFRHATRPLPHNRSDPNNDYGWGHPQLGAIRERIEGRVPVLEVGLDGFEGGTTPGVPEEASFTVENRAGVAARSVTLNITVPVGYLLLPRADADPGEPGSALADPAPDRVHPATDAVNETEVRPPGPGDVDVSVHPPSPDDIIECNGDYCVIHGLPPLDDVVRVDLPNPRRHVDAPDHVDLITLSWDLGEVPVGTSLSVTAEWLPAIPGDHPFTVVVDHEDPDGRDLLHRDVLYRSVEPSL